MTEGGGTLVALGAKLQDAFWHFMLFMGAYVAYKQGWLPFLLPPDKQAQPQGQGQAAAGATDGQAAAEAEPKDPADPATEVSGLGLWCPAMMGGLHGTLPYSAGGSARPSGCRSQLLMHSLASCTQEAHKAAIASLTDRAKEHASKMNDKNLTIEHMVLALAENPRSVHSSPAASAGTSLACPKPCWLLILASLGAWTAPS